MEIEVGWIDAHGDGGALDGQRRVVRLPGAVPGDVVRYAEVGVRGRGVDGEVLELVRASPDRREPPCPWSGSCGGCGLDALTPDARHAALTRMVQRALRLPAPPPIVASPRAVGHRARIKLAIDGGRVGYRAGRSHQLVEIGTCAIARPEVQDALVRLRAALPADTAATEVELRSDGARVVFAFHGGRPSAEERAALAALGDVAWDGRALHGDPTLWLPVGDLRLRAGPGAFYQVNLEVNALLVAHVGRWLAGGERLLDLYAGIGNLGLPIAAAGTPVMAVEQSASALADLRATAEVVGLTNVRTLAVDAARFDPSREAYDVAVLDPPRAGAGEVLGRVLRNRPRRVALVSCDPLAAGRDHGIAAKSGYILKDVTCFDLFPDTPHVEVVSVFDRPR